MAMLLLGVAVIACAEPAASPTEGLPGAGYISVVGSPTTAANDGVGIDVRDASGELVTQAEIPMGTRIVTQFAVLPGSYDVSAGGGCSNPVAVSSGMETDLTLRQGDQGCSLEVGSTHPADSADHPLFGALTVTIGGTAIPTGLTAHLVSVDDPPNPVPTPASADESGRFFLDGIPQGRYRIEVRAGEAILGAADITIGTGASSTVSVEVPISR